jgi:hypothetical protein
MSTCEELKCILAGKIIINIDNVYFNWSDLQKSAMTFGTVNFLFIVMYLNGVSFISTVSSMSLMLLLVSVVICYFQKDVKPK